MIQGSPEWLAARVGKVTASRIADVVLKTKAGKPTAARADYLAEIVTETLTGQPLDFFQTKAMQWGVEKEPEAREAYEAAQYVEVVQVGLVNHPYIERAGASPDGLVGVDGMTEIKCPNTKTHILTLMSSEAPEEYIPQMQWQMACTDRVWVDFISYDPRLPEAYQLFIKRVYRDQLFINQCEQEVRQFLLEVDNTISKLQQRKAA